MKLRWLTRRHPGTAPNLYAADFLAPSPSLLHRVEADFSYARCRFVLNCTCGAHHETNFIDEALEWREMHERLAPLADLLPVPAA